MNKINKTIIIISMMFILILTSCSKKIENNKTVPKKFLFLSSVFYIDIRDDREDKELIKEEIYKRLEDLEKKLSLHLPTSDISKINQNAGKEFVKVSNDTINCIKKSLELSKITKDNKEGSFNIRIGPIVKLWGIGTADEKIPEKNEIEKRLPLLNADIEVDYDKNEVFLEKDGMMLDLGASAKGYACDEIVKILKNHNVENAIIDLGGNVYVLGNNYGKNFKVGIQNPLSNRGEYFGIIALGNKSVVTSGTYERYFEKDGIRYHHILSDITGYPVNNSLISVTIISENSMEADILSTSLYLLGLDKALEKANSMQEISAVFITKDNEVYMTDDIKDDFILTDKNTFRIM